MLSILYKGIYFPFKRKRLSLNLFSLSWSSKGVFISYIDTGFTNTHYNGCYSAFSENRTLVWGRLIPISTYLASYGCYLFSLIALIPPRYITTSSDYGSAFFLCNGFPICRKYSTLPSESRKCENDTEWTGPFIRWARTSMTAERIHATYPLSVFFIWRLTYSV